MENNRPQTVFISKGTPEDNAFAAWLGPRLEARGYSAFADVLNLKGGDRWRNVLTNTLRDNSIKMLLCCSDTTLSKTGVLEEIEIANFVSKKIKDDNFIIPLRLKPYQPVFGITGLQYVDFSHSWAAGLKELLNLLEDYGVPKSSSKLIDPRWSAALSEGQIEKIVSPEPLTSNWLRIEELPDEIFLIGPKGYANIEHVQKQMKSLPFPKVNFERGFITFASPKEMNDLIGRDNYLIKLGVARTTDFLEDGSDELGVKHWESKKIISNLLRQAWELCCREAGLSSYKFSTDLAFHANDETIGVRKRVKWGRQGQKRSSVLRNITKRGLWEYGFSAKPSMFPFPQFRLKGRVIFSDTEDILNPKIIEDPAKQHRLRRSVCTGWRNKAWHGRMMALLETLSGESSHLRLPLGDNLWAYVDAMPVQFTSPVTTPLRNEIDEDAVEIDETTLYGLSEGPE